MTCFPAHLVLLLLNVLECAGVYAIGRMWFPVQSVTTSPTVRVLRRPVYTCLVCMASLHSVGFFWSAHAASPLTVAEWGVYMLTLAGANAVVERVLS